MCDNEPSLLQILFPSVCIKWYRHSLSLSELSLRHMGRPRIKLHNLCIGHATPRVRACSSSSFRSKSSSTASTTKYANRTEFPSSEDSGRDKGETGNKVMVVVDSSFEAKGALDWALSHTVQSQDTVVLVHVARPFSEGEKKNRMILLFLFVLYSESELDKFERG